MLEGQPVQLPLVTIANQLRLDELGWDNLEKWRTRQLAPTMYMYKWKITLHQIIWPKFLIPPLYVPL